MSYLRPRLWGVSQLDHSISDQISGTHCNSLSANGTMDKKNERQNYISVLLLMKSTKVQTSPVYRNHALKHLPQSTEPHYDAWARLTSTLHNRSSLG